LSARAAQGERRVELTGDAQALEALPALFEVG
jgi:hypothetical protein